MTPQLESSYSHQESNHDLHSVYMQTMQWSSLSHNHCHTSHSPTLSRQLRSSHIVHTPMSPTVTPLTVTPFTLTNLSPLVFCIAATTSLAWQWCMSCLLTSSIQSPGKSPATKAAEPGTTCWMNVCGTRPPSKCNSYVWGEEMKVCSSRTERYSRSLTSMWNPYLSCEVSSSMLRLSPFSGGWM